MTTLTDQRRFRLFASDAGGHLVRDTLTGRDMGWDVGLIEAQALADELEAKARHCQFTQNGNPPPASFGLPPSVLDYREAHRREAEAWALGQAEGFRTETDS